MPIKNRFAELLPEITAWRRDFHENPEILYEVHRTAGVVADKLRAFGVDEVVTGIGRTGVVAVIKGRTDTAGRVVGLRADMDALPIHEQTGAPWASKVPGKMHACGHDGHTAMLLGAVQYLAETRNFDGTVVAMFQPAEEGGKGALAMVEDGVMDRWNVQEVYGMHNAPGVPVGCFAIKPGPLLASADEIVITVTGKGGHAAAPHQAIDTTLVASHIVVALQSIVGRNADPLASMVISVCSFETDSPAHNVIPNQVIMRGTVRTLAPELRDLARARIPALAAGVAAGFGATAVVDYQDGCPVTMNTPENTEWAAEIAVEVAGAERVIRDMAPQMPAEDFSFMLEARPGAYMLIGNGSSAMCHHPAYDFADEAIPFGCSWFATLVERRMPLV